MDAVLGQALALTPASSARDRTVEITTTGVRSGLPRRIEIWFYRVGDTNYLSGMPGRMPDWYRNLEHNPAFLFHLGATTLKCTATPITDPEVRREVFTEIVGDLNQPANPGRIVQPTAIADWLDGSVLVEIRFDD